MSLTDLIYLSQKSLRSNILRSVLTSLGIIIGVSSVITMISIGTGARLEVEQQIERFGSNNPCLIPGYGEFEGLKASIFLEVEGAGHYLPTYAGNLDIMTSAAMGTAQELIKLNS